MVKDTMNGNKGYSLIIAIIGLNLFTIMLLIAKPLWDTVLQRDLEKELIFRGKSYVNAIKDYRKKHLNKYPDDLNILYEEKFIRKLYKDPMSEDGKWNYVMKSKFISNKTLLIVPEYLLQKYKQKANIIGVVSSSPDSSFMTYRGKNRYDEWAFYLGGKENQEMPKLKFVVE